MRSKEEIQKTIIYYLIDNDMTVSALANQINASRTSIYRWMNGKTVIGNKHYLRLLKLFDGYSPSKWILEMNENEIENYMFSN